MFTAEEVTESSLEDQIINKETQLDVLAKYDEKIERLLYILLTEKEKYVFIKRIPNRVSIKQLAFELQTTESDIKWVMKKAERKLEAFRRFISFL